MSGATLVIASTAAIGLGPAFEPRIASVPLTVLPQPQKLSPTLIPLPPKTGGEVSLYFGAVHLGRTPVYLCNPKTVPLIDVTVIMSGFATDVCREESLVSFGKAPANFAAIAPGTAQLIEVRDVMAEGDSIDQRRIRFIEGGQIREGITYVHNQFGPKFIALTFAAQSERS